MAGDNFAEKKQIRMKRFLLSLALVLLSVSSHAQFSQGTMMIGGTVGLEVNKSKDKDNSITRDRSRSVTFALQPQFGIFVSNNLAVGGGLGFSVSNTKSYSPFDGDNSTTTILATIEPFVRYYLPQRIFFQGKFMAGVGETHFGGQQGSASGTLLGGSLAAGYSILLNDHVALEPQIGYESTGYKNKGSDTKFIENDFFIRAGLQIYLRR